MVERELFKKIVVKLSLTQGWLPWRSSQPPLTTQTTHERAFYWSTVIFVFAASSPSPCRSPSPCVFRSVGISRCFTRRRRDLSSLTLCDCAVRCWFGRFQVCVLAWSFEGDRGGLGFRLTLGFCREGGKSDNLYHFWDHFLVLDRPDLEEKAVEKLRFRVGVRIFWRAILVILVEGDHGLEQCDDRWARGCFEGGGVVATASSAGRVFRQIHRSQVTVEMGWAIQVQYVLVRFSCPFSCYWGLEDVFIVFFFYSWCME